MAELRAETRRVQAALQQRLDTKITAGVVMFLLIYALFCNRDREKVQRRRCAHCLCRVAHAFYFSQRLRQCRRTLPFASREEPEATARLVRVRWKRIRETRRPGLGKEISVWFEVCRD